MAIRCDVRSGGDEDNFLAKVEFPVLIEDLNQ